MLKKQYNSIKGNQTMTTQSILRAKQVAARLGISTAAVWYKSNPKSRHYDADFPKPFKISANATGWLESEISGYIEKLAEKRLITERTKHEFTRH